MRFRVGGVSLDCDVVSEWMSEVEDASGPHEQFWGPNHEPTSHANFGIRSIQNHDGIRHSYLFGPS